MQIAVLGIDLGKSSCSVVGLDGTGHVVLRRRMRRDGVAKLAAGLPACTMAMEACCGAHHLGHTASHHGWPTEAAWHQQTREQVFAQASDPRGTLGYAVAAREQYAAGSVAARPVGRPEKLTPFRREELTPSG